MPYRSIITDWAWNPPVTPTLQPSPCFCYDETRASCPVVHISYNRLVYCMYRAGGKRRWRQRHTHEPTELQCWSWMAYIDARLPFSRDMSPGESSIFFPFFLPISFSSLFLAPPPLARPIAFYIGDCLEWDQEIWKGKNKNKLANGEKCTYIGRRQASQPARSLDCRRSFLPPWPLSLCSHLLSCL